MITPLHSLIENYKYDDFPVRQVFDIIKKSNVDVYVAGGVVNRLFSDRSLDGTDIDCYFKDYENGQRPFEKYLSGIKVKSSNGKVYQNNRTESKVNNYTLVIDDRTITFQCVSAAFVSYKTIMETFDWTVCQGVIDVSSNWCITSKEFDQHIKSKELFFTKEFIEGNFPLTAENVERLKNRLKKYIGYGFKPDISIFRIAMLHYLNVDIFDVYK